MVALVLLSTGLILSTVHGQNRIQVCRDGVRGLKVDVVYQFLISSFYI